MGGHNKTGEVSHLLTHQEIADILTARGDPMTAKVAWHLEKQAMRKLAADPVLRQLAEDAGVELAASAPDD